MFKLIFIIFIFMMTVQCMEHPSFIKKDGISKPALKLGIIIVSDSIQFINIKPEEYFGEDNPTSIFFRYFQSTFSRLIKSKTVFTTIDFIDKHTQLDTVTYYDYILTLHLISARYEIPHVENGSKTVGDLKTKSFENISGKLCLFSFANFYDCKMHIAEKRNSVYGCYITNNLKMTDFNFYPDRLINDLF